MNTSILILTVRKYDLLQNMFCLDHTTILISFSLVISTYTTQLENKYSFIANGITNATYASGTDIHPGAQTDKVDDTSQLHTTPQHPRSE